MLKKLHFKSLLLLAVMLIGEGSFALAETITYKHVFTAKPSTGSPVALSGINWSIAATNLNGYNSANYAGVQIGSSKSDGSITLTSVNNWGKQTGSTIENHTVIKEVRLWLNLGGTSVTPTVTIGDKAATSDGTTVVKNSSASSYKDATKVTFTPADDGKTGVVVINVSTVKAGYICAIEIDSEELSAPVAVMGITLPSTADVEVGGKVTLTPTITPANATNKNVTWTTDNPAVATVSSTGVVTGVAEGTAHITATTEEDSEINATCEVNVTEPEFIFFYESFDKCDNNGGNDDVWSGLSTTASIIADNTGWTFSKGYPADQCARFGTGSANGYAQTPALGTAGNLIVSFKAGAWKDANTTLDLEISDGGTLSASSVTLAEQAWSNYEIVIFNATASTKLTFSGNGRFFLDEVKVKEAVKKITVSAAGFATYCSPFALDFSGVTGLTAFKATSEGGNVTFASVGKVPGGEGLLVKGSKGTFRVPVIAEATSIGTNALVGVTSEKTIGKTTNDNSNIVKYNYVLKDGRDGVGFYQVNNENYKVRANSAYLAISYNAASPEAKLFIGLDGETAVEAVAAEVLPTGTAYNLQGQRVGNDYKGVVIVNGKKVIR